jgi:hypothetical protein
MIAKILNTASPERAAVQRVLADPRLDELMKLNDPLGLYAYCLNCRAE